MYNFLSNLNAPCVVSSRPIHIASKTRIMVIYGKSSALSSNSILKYISEATCPVLEPGNSQEILTTRSSRSSECTLSGDYDNIVSILLLNNPHTYMNYVVYCLVEVDFGLSSQEAKNTMRIAHATGDSLVGMYTRKHAENLLKDVGKLNQKCGENLRFMIEG